MKKNLFLLAAVCVLSLSGTACTKVEPGYAGILVDNYGTQKGVEDYPLHTGRVWFNPFTQDVHKFPVFLQTRVWTKNPQEGSAVDESITFNSIEGAIVNTDIQFSYFFKMERIPHIFVEFRQDADVITDGYIHSRVRDAMSRVASNMKVTDIFGAGKQQLLDHVVGMLRGELEPKGILIDSLSFVGEMRVDEKVHASINAVIQAAQRSIEAENKVRQSRAEADQKVAEAKGQADSLTLTSTAEAAANERLAKSLSPELMHLKALAKWDGKLPVYSAGGPGSVPSLFIKEQ